MKLEDRLPDALARIADSIEVDDRRAFDPKTETLTADLSTRRSSHRVVAAIAIVVLGIAGLMLAANRSGTNGASDEPSPPSPSNGSVVVPESQPTSPTTIAVTEASDLTTEVTPTAIAVAVPTTSAPEGGCLYTVVEGDNPMVVASRFGLTVDELSAANEGNPNYQNFLIGRQLIVPNDGTDPNPCPLPTNSADGSSPSDSTPSLGRTNPGDARHHALAAAVDDVLVQLGLNPSSTEYTAKDENPFFGFVTASFGSGTVTLEVQAYAGHFSADPAWQMETAGSPTPGMPVDEGILFAFGEPGGASSQSTVLTTLGRVTVRVDRVTSGDLPNDDTATVAARALAARVPDVLRTDGN